MKTIYYTVYHSNEGEVIDGPKIIHFYHIENNEMVMLDYLEVEEDDYSPIVDMYFYENFVVSEADPDEPFTKTNNWDIWLYAREIEDITVLTIEQVAEKFGLNANKIRIKVC